MAKKIFLEYDDDDERELYDESEYDDYDESDFFLVAFPFSAEATRRDYESDYELDDDYFEERYYGEEQEW